MVRAIAAVGVAAADSLSTFVKFSLNAQMRIINISAHCSLPREYGY